MFRNFFSLKNKIGLFFPILLIFGILAGCGNKSVNGNLSLILGNIKIVLPEGFVENNEQFSGDAQIIGNYKLPVQNGFSDNFVVTVSPTSGNFAKGQIAKLQKKLRLEDFSQKNRSINCNKNKIDYDIVSFKISQGATLDRNPMKIYYSQAYMLQDTKGYILSFASNDLNRSQSYDGIIKSIGCK